MPRVDWGITADVIDDYDREKAYKPYAGKIPPNGVYQFRVKTAKFVAGTRQKSAQARIGLELVPRDQDERQWKGYFITAFLNIMAEHAWIYAPFCDAIGVSGKDFTDRTITDENGNIKRIGKWRNDGSTVILAELRNNKMQDGTVVKQIGWMGELEELATDDDAEDDEYDDEEYEDEEDAEDSEEDEDDGF